MEPWLKTKVRSEQVRPGFLTALRLDFGLGPKSFTKFQVEHFYLAGKRIFTFFSVVRLSA